MAQKIDTMYSLFLGDILPGYGKKSSEILKGKARRAVKIIINILGGKCNISHNRKPFKYRHLLIILITHCCLHSCSVERCHLKARSVPMAGQTGQAKAYDLDNCSLDVF